MISALKRGFKRSNKTEISNCGEAAISLAQANNHLAINLHHLLAEEKGNVFFSPFSLSAVMAMILSAAEGETESEIRSALGYDHAGIEKEDIASIFEQQLSVLLENKHSYRLSCFTSMLSEKGLEVKAGYKQVLAECFKAVLLEVDFKGGSEKAVNNINKWVKKKTNNLISNPLQSLEPDTAVVMLNVMYFKGTWLEKFKKKETFPYNFCNKGEEDNFKKVDMMHMKESFPSYMIEFFPYYEDESLQALQLPYVGEELAMLILLPKVKDGLESVEKSLGLFFVHDIKAKQQMKKVEVFLPRFRLEYTTKSLLPYLRRLGIDRVFTEAAELSVASESPNFSVSEILHKAVLEVNEEGSEAVAATEAEALVSRTDNPVFLADHPFVFVIYNTMSDLILFMGRVDEL